MLRWLGCPEELQADLDAIARAQQALHNTVRSAEVREPVVQALDQLEEWRACELKAVEVAIELLAKADWGFDWETERMRRVTGKSYREERATWELPDGSRWPLLGADKATI